MTLGAAVKAWLRDLKARDLRRSTRAGHACTFRSLEAYADRRDLVDLDQIDADALRNWLEERGLAASTRRTELGRIKAFYRHAVQEGWVDQSPAARIRPPKARQKQTLPLERDEMRRLLAAAPGGSPERALMLLMRWSGLAIGDAVTLPRSDLRECGELVLRRAKSGELVTVLLPAPVIAALEGLPERYGPHYFWTGRSLRETCTKYWRRRLRGVATAAGVEGFHPHRLRDTFAVELLLSGVAMHDVSTLLGHSSVQTTERYYTAWNTARRNRLARIVRGAHRKDSLLRELAQEKTEGSVARTPLDGKLGNRHQANRTPS